MVESPAVAEVHGGAGPASVLVGLALLAASPAACVRWRLLCGRKPIRGRGSRRRRSCVLTFVALHCVTVEPRRRVRRCLWYSSRGSEPDWPRSLEGQNRAGHGVPYKPGQPESRSVCAAEVRVHLVRAVSLHGREVRYSGVAAPLSLTDVTRFRALVA